MKVNLLYPRASLHEAALYIWNNNPSVSKWPSKPANVFEVADSIKETMIQGARRNADVLIREKELKILLHDEWQSYIGTGGFYLLYDLYGQDNEEISLGCQILVDPSLGHPNPGYTQEMIDITHKI